MFDSDATLNSRYVGGLSATKQRVEKREREKVLSQKTTHAKTKNVWHLSPWVYEQSCKKIYITLGV